MRLYNLSKHIILLYGVLFCTLLHTTAFSQKQPPYIGPVLIGDSIKAGKTITVRDTVYYDNTLKQSIAQTNGIDDIISLSINELAGKPIPDTFSVAVRIQLSSVALSNGNTAIIKDTLVVSYSKNNPYNSKAIRLFKNYVSGQLQVMSVVVTGAPSTSVMPLLKLESIMVVDRNYLPTCNAVTTVSNSDSSVVTSGELSVSWPATQFIPLYDLEWTYIDKSALDAGTYNTNGVLDPALIFKNNASRITTSSTSYRIPLLYDGDGTLFYRVRTVQYTVSGELINSPWSSDAAGSGLGSYTFTGHERKLNWQAMTSFAEEGKRKSVVQYFDGSLKGRQTVTKDNTTQTTIVAETFYDKQGRPAIQVLPSPTLSKLIHYTPKFNSINSLEYDKGLYDSLTNVSDYCAKGAPGMDTAGASKYYSPNNPFLSQPGDPAYDKFIPDANKYPFTETRYTRDNTGRIERQGGVGPAFQIGSGHETKYYYGTPTQEDLDALFGTEAGDFSHYQKNMVRDANGQYSVSYIDMSGHTVATALTGNNPVSLQKLDNFTFFNQTDSLLTPTNNIIKDGSIQMSSTILVPKADDYTFHYNLIPESLQLADCNNTNICYDCLYDLNITVTDTCGNSNIVINKSNFKLFKTDGITYNLDTSCAAPAILDTTFTLHLTEGSHEISKVLSISKASMNYYRDSMFMKHNTCTTYNQLVISQMDSLHRRLDCTTDMATSYLTDSYRAQMKADMRPLTGQYADTASSSSWYSIFDKTCIGIFHTLCMYNYQLINGYLDENGQPDTVTTANGLRVPPQLLPKADFIANFKDSWLETLIRLHPEYSLLVQHEAIRGVDTWESDFFNTDTYDSAISKGYLNPTGSTIVPANQFTINKKDSVVLYTTTLNAGAKTSLETSLNNYVIIKGKTYNLWNIATATTKCPAGDSACMVTWATNANAFNTSQMCKADLDMAWRMFRGAYLQIRNDWIDNFTRQQAGNPAEPVAPCTPVFPSKATMAQYNNPAQGSYYGYTGSASDTTTAKNNMQQYLYATCKAYAIKWWQELAPCNYTAKDSLVILPYLINVCYEGSDADHPLGSRTVKPTSTYRFRSFDEVIQFYNDSAYHGTKSLLACNADLISLPKPYNQPAIVVNKPVLTTPDTCTCNRINTLYQEYQFYSSSYSSFSIYMQQVYNTTISQGALDSLRSLCTVSSSCRYLQKPIIIPPALQCNATPVCTSCDTVRSLYKQFVNKYGNMTLAIQEADTLQRNRNQLFANFMNNQLGYAKQAQEYLNFMKQCSIAYSLSTICDSINAVTTDFYTQYNAPRSITRKYDTNGCDTSRWDVNWGNSSYNLTPLSPLIHNGVFTPLPGDTLHGTCVNIEERDTICLSNGFALEARLKVPKTGFSGQPAWSRYSFWFSIYSSTETVNFNMVQDATGNKVVISGLTSSANLTFPLPSDFTNYVTVKVLVKTTQYLFYFNGKYIGAAPHPAIQYILSNYFVPLTPSFTLDYMKYYDGAGNVIMQEDFNDCSNMAYVINSGCKLNCADSFTAFFNNTYHTNYTFSTLDSKSQTSCGKALNICNTTCDSLSNIINKFPCYYSSLDDSNVQTGQCGQTYWTINASNSYTAQDSGFYSTTNTSEFINNGVLTVPQPAVSMRNGSVVYNLIRPICINNQYTVEYKVKNVSNTDMEFFVSNHSNSDASVSNDEDFTFDFASGGNGFYTYRHGAQVHATGLQNKSFDTWQTVKLVATTDSFKVYYNGTLALGVRRDGHSSIDQLYGLYFTLNGTTDKEIDWIKWSIPGTGGTDEVVYYEDFNSPYALSRPNPAFLCPKPVCTDAFTALFNNTYGTGYTYADLNNKSIQSCGKELNICSPSSQPLLCGKQAEDSTIILNFSPCADTTFEAAKGATFYFNLYRQSLQDNFNKLYTNKCLNAVKLESFTVTHPLSEYQYTLYFYDEAGNLVKTVPPAGVHPIRGADTLQNIRTARRNKGVLTPAHTLVTTYRYNSLNQVISQQSPDGGLTQYWYDIMGRLVVSRNAKQKAEGYWSYTLYDSLGRISEVGKKQQPTVMTDATSRNPQSLKAWLNYTYTVSGTTLIAEQVTTTVYDVRNPQTAVLPANGYVLSPSFQKSYTLRNRVSYTQYYDKLQWNGTAALYGSYNNSTTYSYDIHGNVDTLLSHYRTGVMSQHGYNQFKTTAYRYDLVSGKVNEVHYQPGMNDQLYHRYEYDAENRLVNVYTTDRKALLGLSGLEEHEAAYQYYRHGPLAKAIIGQQQVQALNYAYTLQGWLKAVNADSTMDDALTARSAYNYSLHYYKDALYNDYSPIGTGTIAIVNAGGNADFKPLYNGNIGAMAVNIKQLSQPLVYNYGYDQLNRLVSADAYSGWNGVSIFAPQKINDYKERLTYDPNGNILSYFRNGTTKNGNPLAMDSLVYQYPEDVNGNLINNRLRYIYDTVPSGNYTVDIDKQTTLALKDVQAEKLPEQVSSDNYVYDAIGNLTKDVQGGISSINWTVYGKIDKITKTDGTVIDYSYDAAGNRIKKAVTVNGITTTTWYVRDAQGNTMAVYTENAGVLKLVEQHLYGSSRVGIWNRNIDMDATLSATNTTFVRDMKSYELTNHLGNVLVTLSDTRQPIVVNNVVTGYQPAVVSASDNYSFGMLMPERNFSAANYRYGFNGKENDNEVKKDVNGNNIVGAQQDFGKRIYDPRVGKFLSVDPLIDNYPNQSPYVFASDNPVLFIDRDGEGTTLPPLYDASHFMSNVGKAHPIMVACFMASQNSSLSHLQKGAWYNPFMSTFDSRYHSISTNFNTIYGVSGEVVMYQRFLEEAAPNQVLAHPLDTWTNFEKVKKSVEYAHKSTKFYFEPDKLTDYTIEYTPTNNEYVFHYTFDDIKKDIFGNHVVWSQSIVKDYTTATEFVHEVKVVSPKNKDLLSIIEKGVDQLLTNPRVNKGGIPILVIDRKAANQALKKDAARFTNAIKRLNEKGGGLATEVDLNTDAKKNVDGVFSTIRKTTAAPGSGYYNNTVSNQSIDDKEHK